MKIRNYSICLILVAALFTSCAASKQARSMRSDINGNWVLQSSNIEGIAGNLAAKVFNEAALDCFTGSIWHFDANNSLGSYSLVSTASPCPTLERRIRWSLFEVKDAPIMFQFKRLDDKNNPMDDNNGFRSILTMANANSMQWKSAIMVNGVAGNIVYNFVKN